MKFRILILVFFMPFLLGAQDMSLEDCIQYAFEHNIALANQKIQSKIAKENYLQARRDLLPAFGAGSGADMFFGKSIDPTTNDFVNERLFSTSFYLNSQLELFNGFVKQNNIKFNRLQLLISREDVRQGEIELRFQIMNHYYDALYYQSLLKLTDEQLALTQLNLQKTQKLIDLGLKAESDLLEMQAQEAAEVHNQLQVKNNWDNALLNLKKLLHFPVEDMLVLKQEDNSTVEALLSMNEIYHQAVSHMPLIKKAALDVKATQKGVALAKGQLFPSLLLGANYGTNFADSRKEKRYPEDENSTEMRTIPFEKQFSQNASQSVFLRLNVPIFYQWGRHSKVKQAKHQLNIAENNQKDMARVLYQQIADDYQQLQALSKEKEQLIIQQKALQKAYEIADKKLNQGLISVIEFYAAKNQVAKAKADLLRTETLLKIKEKTMEIYTGN